MFDHLFKTELTPEEEQQIIETTLKNYSEHLNPGFVQMKRSAKSDAHGVEWRGEGVWMYNIHGHRFLDCLGGYGVFALGHRHPHVIKRVKQTMERIGLYSQELLNPLQAVLAKEIADRAPGDLKYVYYHCGGAETNDAAFKLARLTTGRQVHVTFTKSFHGKTFGALSATNRPVLKKKFRPLVPGFFMAPYNDIDALKDYITEEVASVIVEPIQGEGGINVPDREFLNAIRRLCDETGALMHVDEVQSGWGRTGHYFCSEHFGIEPDIVSLGKALGGGLATQSAFIANDRAFYGRHLLGPNNPGATENPWWFTNTFAGSQLSCAASLASIEVYEQEHLLAKAREKGEYLKSRIADLVAKHPRTLKEIRGLGLWLGLECQTGELGAKLADELFARDILVAQTINNPATIRIQPPLIVEQAELDIVLNGIEDSVIACESVAKAV
ncbi:aminotransferase class III-fold pyridoxal phosphate-dependent enzyme [bacterium]|nr:aminotransferase class III-fold pyridoxal phosphate-dependent enzyme [bacterium]